ncbi:hypothetical protein TRVA0_016S01420 [Trichomonascus vanleenenianus]|uniref:uncharacterized protein n=1 Tax=Trichomonascus vanleenenianus TaxID=2268995 RepID=UPI003EC95A3B
MKNSQFQTIDTQWPALTNIRNTLIRPADCDETPAEAVVSTEASILGAVWACIYGYNLWTEKRNRDEESHGASVVLEQSNEPDSQEILSLLFVIAEDQARRTGYIHRGVTCNYCDRSPIHGTRYHCSECIDVDLCQLCESAQRHDPKHLLIKIKIPIPLVKSPRWVRKSHLPEASLAAAPELKFSKTLPRDLECKLASRLAISASGIQVMHVRFKNYADVALPKSTSALPYGITRETFQQAVVPRSPHSLIARQISAMYDKDGDGVICFEEFIDVFDIILYGSNRGTVSRPLLAYKMFDLDKTGYISKANVARVLESYYELVKDIISDISEGDSVIQKVMEGALTSPRPLSAHFGVNQATPESSLPPKDKSFIKTPSIVELVRERMAEEQAQDKSKQAVASHVKAFGSQALTDMDKQSKQMLRQWIDAVWRDFGWPDSVRYSPTMFGPQGEKIRHFQADPLCDWLAFCII